jgi:hypothetical protein
MIWCFGLGIATMGLTHLIAPENGIGWTSESVRWASWCLAAYIDPGLSIVEVSISRFYSVFLLLLFCRGVFLRSKHCMYVVVPMVCIEGYLCLLPIVRLSPYALSRWRYIDLDTRTKPSGFQNKFELNLKKSTPIHLSFYFYRVDYPPVTIHVLPSPLPSEPPACLPQSFLAPLVDPASYLPPLNSLPALPLKS